VVYERRRREARVVVNGMTDTAREGGSACARWHEVDGEGAWVRWREGDEREMRGRGRGRGRGRWMHERDGMCKSMNTRFPHCGLPQVYPYPCCGRACWISHQMRSHVAYIILLCTPHPATNVIIVHDDEGKISSQLLSICSE